MSKVQWDTSEVWRTLLSHIELNVEGWQLTSDSTSYLLTFESFVGTVKTQRSATKAKKELTAETFTGANLDQTVVG